MKKHIASILSAGLFITLHAQSIEIGARGGVDSFWLLNSAVSNTPKSESKTFSLSYNGGLHLAYDITDQVGIETNFLYASLNQTYSGTFQKGGMLPDGGIYLSGQSYTSKINMTAYQIPLLLCLETATGSFVELGAEYDMIQTANYSGNYSNPGSTNDFNASSAFAKSNVLGVFGVGGKYSINDYIFILTDFRITYGFTDIQGVDGLGQHYNSTPYYTDIKPTNTLTGSFNLGIFCLIPTAPSYKIGHKCHGTPKVRSGNHHS